MDTLGHQGGLMQIPHLLMGFVWERHKEKARNTCEPVRPSLPRVLILHVLLHKGFFEYRIPGPIFPTIPVDFIVWLHVGVSFTKAHEAELTAKKTKTKRLMQRAHPLSITLPR